MIEFRTHPEQYRHWRFAVEGAVATLTLDVQEDGGLAPGYELKLNSYDMAVDIELADAVQRLRFEYPGVGAVVITSAKERVFCAGANIRMLAASSHEHKVNFCRFTNETRNAIEDAGAHSGQHYLCAINGTAAGGGYELALAAEYIVLVDDRSSAVSLPEVPLLGVLPGTGGLTRMVDKRRVRRDIADYVCTLEEGVRGERAVRWRLVDEVAPPSRFAQRVKEKALEFVAASRRPDDAVGIVLTPLERQLGDDQIRYAGLDIEMDRERGVARFVCKGPDTSPPAGIAGMVDQGAAFWPLALARALDDAVVHLRANEPTIGIWTLHSQGDIERVAAFDAFLHDHGEHWLAREILLLWKRVLKRFDVTSRSLIALIEPGSCFAGFLAELVLVADRGYMLDGVREGDNRSPAVIRLSPSNLGTLPAVNGITRLESRYLDDPEAYGALGAITGQELDAADAMSHRLVTFAPDDIDWDDEIRLAIEERGACSPDALTGMEANLRFAGPETMESKIFGRLSAWQNWIFQRPGVTTDSGALKRYGSGIRAEFDKRRV